ncbi:MAG: putative baseplate assembly protein [Nitrosomonas sp.]|nr:putative baseplate assembly protein [Nitrosomonas sp.]
MSYRTGTHATFLETMKARLSSSDYPKLAQLTSRETGDFSLAIMDAWATVADVLTFYQERIANEGFLRTATERRSVLELGRLVGYQPRPGVASSVYLAYTIDDNFKEETIIPKGARSQSIPGPGEMPQSFETSEDLKARAQWNDLKPRTSKFQEIKFDQSLRVNKIYLKGVANNLKSNDPILLVYGEKAGEKILRRTVGQHIDFDNDSTEVLLQEVPFLIGLSIDLMRLITDKLDEVLKDISLDADENGLLQSLDKERPLLQRVLDSQSLGQYPPLHEAYFSHERIYKFFLELRTLKIGKEAVASRLNPWKELVKSKVGKANIPELIKAAINILNLYRQDLICFLRHIVGQLFPNDLSEQENLKIVASNTIPILNDYYSQWGKILESEFNEISNTLILLFSDEGLRSNSLSFVEFLLGLIPIDDKNVRGILEKLAEWLRRLSTNAKIVSCGVQSRKTTNLDELISPLSPLIKPPAIQVKNSSYLSPGISKVLSKNSNTVPELLINFQPLLKPVLYQAMANAILVEMPKMKADSLLRSTHTLINTKDSARNEQPKSPKLISIHALRLSASLFGNNAPKIMGLKVNEDAATKADVKFISTPDGDWNPLETREEDNARLYLDNAYDEVKQGAHIIINDHYRKSTVAAMVADLKIRPRTAYSVSGRTTQIELSKEWWSDLDMESLRKSMVYVETESLILSEAPDLAAVSGQVVDLQAFHGGLSSGRWVIVSGELLELPGDILGVRKAELAMLSTVQYVANESLLNDDKTHTRVIFDKPLVNSYKRDTVTIHGNVVQATHGETRKETLGSGDGAKALQSFTLKQPPLTYAAATNPSGVDSTLKVFVNDVQWHETNTLVGLSSTARNFSTRTGDEGKTTVVFGNGREGARLPTGIENIKAEYRNGIGKTGNVKAEQISLLTTRPLGVKEVINPLRASGGADKETRDQARRNVPLGVKVLDRLVSVQDYEDFARIFAGIGKACAVELSDGSRQLVHITIAGADDIPIEPHSDLFRNLQQALLDSGDPYQAIELEIRELMLIVITAGIRILPDYQWESVESSVRTALLDAFSFDRRELGQDVLLSEVISVMQAVRGVAYVDVDIFGGLPEKIIRGKENKVRELCTPADIASIVEKMGFDEKGKPKSRPDSRIPVNLARTGAKLPAQLAFMTPDVPATLNLIQIS